MIALALLGLISWMTLGAAICASVDDNGDLLQWAEEMPWFGRTGPAVLALFWPLVVWFWHQDISGH